MIEFYNVNLDINSNRILSNISFRIVKGEFSYLVGPSGAGKSSILRMIYMDVFPASGMVVVDRYSSAKIRRKDISMLRRKIGVIFQDFKLLSDRTVFDNVAFSLHIVGERSKDIKRRVLKVLTEVNLSHKRNQFPDELSGGEKQRVSIARAIVNNPIIVLADEPTGNLDHASSVEIMSILERINRQGTAVLMATHDASILQKYQHRKISIDQGELNRK
jgi:cell division transport system ATP-binding protein